MTHRILEKLREELATCSNDDCEPCDIFRAAELRISYLEGELQRIIDEPNYRCVAAEMRKIARFALQNKES